MASYVQYDPVTGQIQGGGSTRWEFVEKYVSGEMENSLGLKTIPIPIETTSGSIWQLFPDYWTAYQNRTLYVNPETKQLRTTLIDPNYPLPTASLDQSSYSISERNVGSASAGITVSLSAPSKMPTFVFYKATSATANDQDYDPGLPAFSSVTFAPGETTKILPIIIFGDSNFEENETFLIDLIYPSGLVFKPGDQHINGTHAIVTILNDDPAVRANSQWQNGTSSDDHFFTTKSGINDRIDGKEGINTVVYSHSRADYTITRAQPDTGWITISDKTSGRDGTDSLVNISNIKFTDGLLAVDSSNNPDNALIYRLYQAALARTPDEGGFRFWIEQHNAGLGFEQLAGFFRGSDEFIAKYGANLSNSQYVDQLYKNVLGRIGEQEGTDYWNGVLNSGSATKDQVLIGFAGSTENVAKTAPNIDIGYWLV